MPGTIISALSPGLVLPVSVCIFVWFDADLIMNDITVSLLLVCPKLESDDQSPSGWWVYLCIIWRSIHAALLALIPQVHFLKLSSRVNICIRTVCAWVKFDFALLP